MAFRDLDEFLVVEPVVLPIRGKEYSFPGEVSARTWLLLQRLAEQWQSAAPDDEVVDDTTEAELRAELMGDTLQEMLDDGLTSAHVKAVLYTLLAFHLGGREAAEVVWERQGKAAAPNRETRRTREPTRSTRSRGSRAGSTSRKGRPGAASSPTGA